ncbi:MAG: hypothetical protein HYU64_17535 [Armatimonadetes bacterium]|nr:hypothetical protein [Armatimonadota bacterium]
MSIGRIPFHQHRGGGRSEFNPKEKEVNLERVVSDGLLIAPGAADSQEVQDARGVMKEVIATARTLKGYDGLERDVRGNVGDTAPARGEVRAPEIGMLFGDTMSGVLSYNPEAPELEAGLQHLNATVHFAAGSGGGDIEQTYGFLTRENVQDPGDPGQSGKARVFYLDKDTPGRVQQADGSLIRGKRHDSQVVIQYSSGYLAFHKESSIETEFGNIAKHA